MGSGTGPITGIPWDRETGDATSPEDHNLLARMNENTFAKVLMNLIFEDGFVNRSPDVPLVDEDTGWIEAPAAGDPIIGIVYGRCFYMASDLELDCTASGGDTTYVTCDALSEASDFWNDAWVIFTSGLNDGTALQVSDYDLTQKRLTLDGVLGNAAQAGDTFVLTFFYVQDLTNGSENWIFGRTATRTTRDGLIQWVANTTGTKVSGDIMAAKVTLDVAGNVVSVDEMPTGHDRSLWHGAAASHRIEFSGTVTGLLPGAYVDVDVSHSDLILLGPITGEDGAAAITVSPAEACATPIEYWAMGSITLRITNDSSYTSTVTYAGERWGRKKVLL